MLRRALNIAAWAACVALVLVMWPTKFGGYTSYTIVSGDSMEPSYHTGDLVIGWRDGSYEPGDIVVFTVPEGEVGAGYQVIHRIIAGDENGWVTQGDNKATPDPWLPTNHDINGQSLWHFPGAGSAILWLPVPIAILAGILVTVALWPRKDDDEQESADAPETSGFDEDVQPDRSEPAALIAGKASIAVLLLGVALGLAAPASSVMAAHAANLGGIDIDRMSSWQLDEQPAAPAEPTDELCEQGYECDSAGAALEAPVPSEEPVVVDNDLAVIESPGQDPTPDPDPDPDPDPGSTPTPSPNATNEPTEALG